MNKINRMYAVSFLFSLHIALSAYVNSTFLLKFISEKYVGILYTIASVITLLLLTKSVNILKHFGNRKFLLINMISLFGMILSNNAYIISASFIGLMTTNTLVYLSIDIFIEHFGNPLTVGKTRGIYLMIVNLAWMLCPLVTSFLITKEGGYISIYLLSFIATIAMTIGLILSVRTFTDKTYKKTPFLETFRYLKTNHHMLAITMINFILQFFFALMVIYTPIYLFEHIGFGWQQIGIIFTIMLAPFVIFGFPIGILIDKYHIKKRNLLYVGVLIMSAATFSMSYVTLPNVALWAFILFMTRTGACIVEATSEIYFFTHITEEDTYLLSIFRDMNPVSYIIAPLISTLFFIFLPLKFLFAILGIFILSSLYYIPRLKHNHSPIQIIQEQTL